MSNLININSNFISQYKSEKVKIGVIVEQPYVVKRNLSDDTEKDTYYDGIFIEILNEILDRQPNWEVTLEYVDYSKQRALEELRAGKFDILIGNISVTEKTKKLSNFTKNLFLNMKKNVHFQQNMKGSKMRQFERIYYLEKNMKKNGTYIGISRIVIGLNVLIPINNNL